MHGYRTSPSAPNVNIATDQGEARDGQIPVRRSRPCLCLDRRSVSARRSGDGRPCACPTRVSSSARCSPRQDRLRRVRHHRGGPRRCTPSPTRDLATTSARPRSRPARPPVSGMGHHALVARRGKTVERRWSGAQPARAFQRVPAKRGSEHPSRASPSGDVPVRPRGTGRNRPARTIARRARSARSRPLDVGRARRSVIGSRIVPARRLICPLPVLAVRHGDLALLLERGGAKRPCRRRRPLWFTTAAYHRLTTDGRVGSWGD